MPWFQKLTLGSLLTISVAAILWIGYVLGRQDLTTNEAVLSNLLLVFFSILASTIVSHFYFEASNKRSLGMYAKKAAEKVSNLSSQLSKLSLYLQQEDDDQLRTPEEILLIKNERLRGAIHIVETLQSVNDRSLSDWRGIVPEKEIQEAQEHIENQEDRFKQLVEEFRDVLEQSATYSEEDDLEDGLRQEIGELKKEMQKVATGVIGTPIISNPKKQSVSLECPSCKAVNNYRQKPMLTSQKHFRCEACYTPLVSTWNQVHGFSLAVDKNPPRSSAVVTLDESLIEQVKSLLPEQPWPKGISKEVQEQIGINSSTIKKVVHFLIIRGDFKPQKDGVLYEFNTDATTDPQDKKKDKALA